MSTERTGTIYTGTADYNSAVTVPADATMAIVTVGYPAPGNPTTSLGGQAFTLVDEYPYSTGINGESLLYKLSSPPTGSQTFYFTNVGGRWNLLFFKGTTAIRDTAKAIAPSNYGTVQTITSPEFDVVDGDLCCVTVFGYTGGANPDASPDGAGQTDYTPDQTSNAVGYKVASGTGTTTMQGRGQYPSIIAWSFVPSSTGNLVVTATVNAGTYPTVTQPEVVATVV